MVPLEEKPRASWKTLFTNGELVVEEVSDNYCKVSPLQVHRPNKEFHLDVGGVIIQNSIVDETDQIRSPCILT